MDKTSLGDRMKENYEKRYEYKLLRRTPVIIRLDGRSFHTVTRGCDKPFDNNIIANMVNTARYLCENIQGAKCAYTQSDEISILLIDYDTIDTQAWFDYDLQKVVSISASLASTCFSESWGKKVEFDSRAFNIPIDEVVNYFIWRQKDWIRNSVQMLAQANFSHKQLQGRGQYDMHEMLHEKGINWAELDDVYKNGTFITSEPERWTIRQDIIFTQDRESIEVYLKRKGE